MAARSNPSPSASYRADLISEVLMPAPRWARGTQTASWVSQSQGRVSTDADPMTDACRRADVSVPTVARSRPLWVARARRPAVDRTRGSDHQRRRPCPSRWFRSPRRAIPGIRDRGGSCAATLQTAQTVDGARTGCDGIPDRPIGAVSETPLDSARRTPLGLALPRHRANHGLAVAATWAAQIDTPVVSAFAERLRVVSKKAAQPLQESHLVTALERRNSLWHTRQYLRSS